MKLQLSGTLVLSVLLLMLATKSPVLGQVPMTVPTAQVSGNTNLCVGGSGMIQAALTGTAPWNLVWSDGFHQTGIATSPAVRTVSPSVTTIYQVLSVSDAGNASGLCSGEAVVRVLQSPVITSQPADTTLCPGSTATFSVVANGTPSGVNGSSAVVASTSAQKTSCACLAAPLPGPECDTISSWISRSVAGMARTSGGTTSYTYAVIAPQGEGTNTISSWLARSAGSIAGTAGGTTSYTYTITAPLGKRSDTILVKPKKQVTHANLAAHHQKIGATVKRTFSRFDNLQVVKLPPGLTVTNAIKQYQDSGLVEYAEPDYQVHAVLSPNDPRYLDGSLWNLNLISAPAGWDIRTSADPIIVAVIDTGVWYSHADLASNMWVNPCVGCPVDGVVYPNDVYGINAITGTGDPLDDMFHGTHCAGIIGAVGNNGIGGVGVVWNVRIMACKFLDANGSGYTSDAIECINYALNKGAKVLSCSWGGSSYDQALHDAIATARDANVILVAAAGNSAADNDASSFYPANYDSDLDNVVAVAATDGSDQLASFSDYGAASVALGAPGVNIFSTLPGIETAAMQSYGLTTNYGILSGTSMACPHVAGVMAMVCAQYPTDSHAQIIQRVLGNTDPVSSLNGRTLTGGRLNLFNALAQPLQPPFWLTYQWRMNGTNIPGKTGSSYSFGPVTTNDNGDHFDVVISNPCGTVLSTAAVLTVDTSGLITKQPTSMTQYVGDSAMFSVSARGSTPLSYRWRKIGGGWSRPWVLTENGPGSGSLFIGSSTNNGDRTYNPSYPTDLDTDGKAFGINASGGHTMQVARSLIEPLPPGGVFTISMDNGYVGANGAAGIAMYSVSNQLWFEFFCTNNMYYYSSVGITPTPATWIPFTSHPINFYFDMFPDGLLFIVVNDPSGAGTLFEDYIPAMANDPPDHFVLYNNNAGNGPANDIYFNGLGLYERYDLGNLVGYDDAIEAAYTNGWQSGDDGGTGPIPGATNSAYVIPSCALTDSGTYNVIVDNPCNFLVSSNAGLTVLPQLLPVIVAQPTNQTVTVGDTATFSVTAAGSLPLNYQWSFNGTNIDRGTNTSLTLTNVQLNQAGNYAVLVTNMLGSILSSNAALTVLAIPPVITTQPANQTVSLGFTASFSVIAGGSLPLYYQWAFNGTNIDWGTNTFLTLTNVQLNQAGNYAVLVTNAYGATNSATATLTVTLCDPPPSGLVAWWRAEGNANDSVGTNNGVAQNITYTNGMVGQAFVFFGSASQPHSRISVPDQPIFELTNSLSIEGWINPAGAGGNSGMILWRGDCRGGYDPYFFQMNGDNTLGFTIEDASGVAYGQVNTPKPLANNQWYHVAATLDGNTGNMCIYTNGVLAAQTNTPVRPFGPLIPSQEPSLGIGNVGTACWDYVPFNGALDEISLYSRALASNEIQAIYNAGGAGKCIPGAPFIATQPTNQTVNVGGTATFTVVASGTPPLSYQWNFNGTNIVWATNTTLTLTNVQLNQAGNYAVLVTNLYGSILSFNAVLTVVTLDHFGWNPIPSPRFVNTPFSVVIRARDMTNGLFTNFTGTAILGTTNGVAVTPAVSGNFIQGVWTGAVMISQTASNLVLRADDGLGHFGLANPINVISLPKLGMLCSGNIALYMWPVGYPGFVLETSGTLSPATWVVVPYSPIQMGDQYLLPLDMTGTNGFYRLWFPGP